MKGKGGLSLERVHAAARAMAPLRGTRGSRNLATTPGRLESKIETLHGDCVNEKNKLKDVFAAAMVKIPKSVKAMRVAEFNALYKCDILSVIENLPAPAAGKKRDRLETPSQQTRGGGRLPLATPSRTVRKGEMLL